MIMAAVVTVNRQQTLMVAVVVTVNQLKMPMAGAEMATAVQPLTQDHLEIHTNSMELLRIYPVLP